MLVYHSRDLLHFVFFVDVVSHSLLLALLALLARSAHL